MRHLKGINESLGNGEQEFEQKFDGSFDVEVDGMPSDWSARDLNITENGKIKWNLSLNLNSKGIEWFGTSVRQIIFFGMFDDDEEIEFEIQDNIETELYNITQSFYPSNIEVNMNNSTDSNDWKVKVYFGNPT
jgi:hypothetical protein